jgi:hypothetical protein
VLLERLVAKLINPSAALRLSMQHMWLARRGASCLRGQAGGGASWRCGARRVGAGWIREPRVRRRGASCLRGQAGEGASWRCGARKFGALGFANRAKASRRELFAWSGWGGGRVGGVALARSGRLGGVVQHAVPERRSCWCSARGVGRRFWVCVCAWVGGYGSLPLASPKASGPRAPGRFSVGCVLLVLSSRGSLRFSVGSVLLWRKTFHRAVPGGVACDGEEFGDGSNAMQRSGAPVVLVQCERCWRRFWVCVRAWVGGYGSLPLASPKASGPPAPGRFSVGCVLLVCVRERSLRFSVGSVLLWRKTFHRAVPGGVACEGENLATNQVRGVVPGRKGDGFFRANDDSA